MRRPLRPPNEDEEEEEEEEVGDDWEVDVSLLPRLPPPNVTFPSPGRRPRPAVPGKAVPVFICETII